MKQEFTIRDPFDYDLHTILWETDMKQPLGVVMIIHGKGEHIGRYEDFATFLNQSSFHVIGCDLRGHGNTSPNEKAVYFDTSYGFHKVYEGVKSLRDYISNQYPKLPVILFGHSIGSFIARYALLHDARRYDLAIFSGTSYYSTFQLFLQKLLVRILIKIKGDTYVSDWFNTCIADRHIRLLRKRGMLNQTGEWTLQERKERIKLEQDPLANRPFTLGAQLDLLKFIPEIQNYKQIKKSASATALYFISGERDSFGQFGKAAKHLFDLYLKSGYSNVNFTVLNNTNHDILHDIERDLNYQIILNWMKKYL
jgi:alpha-beta hydrolase superfamily lysophospholipase